MTDELTPTCARCKRPLHHDTALICSNCSAHLGRQLELVQRIAGDITLTVAKLAHVYRNSGETEDLGWHKAANALEPWPLPVDLAAAERHDAAVNTLSTWARVISAERGRILPVIWAVPARGATGRLHPLATLAWWVQANLEWLRHHPAADEAWLDLLAACGQLERVVDTQVPDEIVGLCSGCGTALYGPRCRRCRTETNVETSRAELLAQREAAAVTASEAAVWVANMGLVADTKKLRDLIYKWRDRGYLAEVDDVPRYRFGDVLRRVLDSPALLRVA